MINLKVGDKITTKKNHPCGSNVWTVIRTGADYKIKCENCGRKVMLSYTELEKRIKNVIGE